MKTTEIYLGRLRLEKQDVDRGVAQFRGGGSPKGGEEVGGGIYSIGSGSVAERLKAPVLKTGDGVTRSWVLIPPLPPFYPIFAL